MKKLLAVRIEPGMLQKLEEIGKREDRTVSYLIRKAIEQFVQSKGTK